jgi:hypothetical protein
MGGACIYSKCLQELDQSIVDDNTWWNVVHRMLANPLLTHFLTSTEEMAGLTSMQEISSSQNVVIRNREKIVDEALKGERIAMTTSLHSHQQNNGLENGDITDANKDKEGHSELQELISGKEC